MTSPSSEERQQGGLWLSVMFQSSLAPQKPLLASFLNSQRIVGGVVAMVVAVFIHGKQEQLVLHQRARAPDIGLEERAVVTAGVGMRGAVAVEMVAAAGAPRAGFGGDFHAALQFVAARTGHRVDHTAGGTAELHRVAAGLDRIR